MNALTREKSKLLGDAHSRTLLEGGDTDTNACIVGGLIGAYGGLGSLPQFALGKVLKCNTAEGQERQEVYTAKLVAKPHRERKELNKATQNLPKRHDSLL